MDHVVHINGGDDGSRAAKPIVLRLMPGEETGFNLKVVNHGEPSNISLQASGPISKAVRLRKPDRYVVMEEVVPVMARMPAGERQLDGAILLSSPAGQSRVPITLLRIRRTASSMRPMPSKRRHGMRRAKENRLMMTGMRRTGRAPAQKEGRRGGRR